MDVRRPETHDHVTPLESGGVGRALGRNLGHEGALLGLERERIGYASAWAALLHAGRFAHEGDLEAAVSSLEQAEDWSKRNEMGFCLAAATRRRGEIRGGEEGAALVARADKWMREQGVLAPLRMTRAYVPGFE